MMATAKTVALHRPVLDWAVIFFLAIVQVGALAALLPGAFSWPAVGVAVFFALADRRAGDHARISDNRVRGEIRLDLVAFRHIVSHSQSMLERRLPKGATPLTESSGYGVPREIVLPTSTINFLGGKIACPNKPKAYLRVLYGDFKKVEYTFVDAAAAETRRPADVAGKAQMQVPPEG